MRVNIHVLQNADRINSKKLRLRKELDEEEDKERNSVTTTQSHWRDDPTFTQIYACRGLEAENISQDLKTIMIIEMYLSEICFGRVLFTYASGRTGWHTVAHPWKINLDRWYKG